MIVLPARPLTAEQHQHLEWCLVELELMAPLPEPEAWGTEEVELVEESDGQLLAHHDTQRLECYR